MLPDPVPAREQDTASFPRTHFYHCATRGFYGAQAQYSLSALYLPVLSFLQVSSFLPVPKPLHSSAQQLKQEPFQTVSRSFLLSVFLPQHGPDARLQGDLLLPGAVSGVLHVVRVFGGAPPALLPCGSDPHLRRLLPPALRPAHPGVGPRRHAPGPGRQVVPGAGADQDGRNPGCVRHTRHPASVDALQHVYPGCLPFADRPWPRQANLALHLHGAALFFRLRVPRGGPEGVQFHADVEAVQSGVRPAGLEN